MPLFFFNSLAECAKRFGPFTRPASALAGIALFSAPLHGASLGDIQIHSALGERFNATVNVTLSDGETVTPDCFQIITPREEGDIQPLRHARIEFRPRGQGGEVHLRGTDYEQEPLLKIALRLRCPEQDTRGITREYSVLLDPREYKGATPPGAIALPVAHSDTAPASKPIAPAALPSRKPARQPTGDQPVIARQPKHSPALARPTPAAPEEFRLQLSVAPIDQERANMPLSDGQKLQLRERLLLLEADDQSAQLLQLKDRLARLEAQLAQLQILPAPRPAETPPIKRQAVNARTKSENVSPWLWAALGTLLLIPPGFILWRRQTRPEEEQTIFAFESNLDASALPDAAETTPATPATPVVAQEASPPPLRSEPWGEEEMDVVSPETVAEEAQLLIDHGLTRQAIELLLQETALRPTALALWMKLFDAYCIAADRKGFEAKARAFRDYFVSEALWEQVQEQGREIDPTNPLYVKTAKTSEDLAILVDGHPPARSKGRDKDLDVIDLMQRPIPSPAAETKPLEPDLSVNFQLPEISVEELNEAWPESSDTPQTERSNDPLFDFDIPSLNPALPENPTPKALGPEDFSSTEDQLMQGIAGMIFSGHVDEACQQLEELLYRGSFEQRLLAAQWLDKLLPVKNSLDAGAGSL